MVWRSKTSVMGIRIGSSEDFGGGDSGIVLRNLQRTDLGKRPIIVRMERAVSWIDKPDVLHAPSLVLFEFLHQIGVAIIGRYNLNRHQRWLARNVFCRFGT